MVPGIFPSQLVILSTGQTYFESQEILCIHAVVLDLEISVSNL